MKTFIFHSPQLDFHGSSEPFSVKLAETSF
jgi:hypothetical protein